MTGKSEGRSLTRRVWLAVAAALLLLASLGFVVIQLWVSRGGDTGAVGDERSGVRYLRPAVSLISVLSTAQSAAVRGDPPDADAVRGAVEEVEAVDALLGAALGTTARWTALRDRIDGLIERRPTGATAYQMYSDVAELALALLTKAGHTSRLTLDPDLDSHYLVDTALRLPAVLVDTGRHVDLVALAETAPPERTADYLSQAAVVRDRVSVHAGGVDEGMRQSVDAMGGRELDPGLAGRVAGFLTAVNDVAPLVQLAETQRQVPTFGELGPRREQLDRAALELSKAALAALDSLLSAREDGIARQRIGVIVAAGLGLGGTGWMLWIALPAQHRRRTVPDGAADDEERPSVDAVPDEHPLVWVDARELLGNEELERVGRAVRLSRQEPEDDAQ